MAKQPDLQRPPGPSGSLLVGVYPQFLRNPAEFLLRTSREYGDLVYFKLGPQHIYLLNRPDYVQEVLVTNAGNFMKSRILQRAKALLGEGLLTSEGQAHLRQRRMVQPAFYRDRLPGYARVMAECSEGMQSRWREGSQFDIAQEMMRLTLAIVGRTLFSADVEKDAAKIGEAMTAVLGMFNKMLMPFADLLELLPLRSVRKAEEAREFLDATIYGMIEERRRSGEDRGDLLSLLLAASDDEDKTATRMTNRQVRDEAMTLFLAGHETTAVALTWACYLLSQHPDVERKLHEELAEVAGSRDIEWQDVPNLRYTEMVLAETMRLYPPAWAVGRMATSYTRIYNYGLPAGSICILSPYAMHRNARYWPEPDRFDPERWTPELREERPKFSYFPFGGGARVCIGERFAWMEATIVLASVYRKWKLKLAPGQKVEIHPQITLRPRGAVQMIAEQWPSTAAASGEESRR